MYKHYSKLGRNNSSYNGGFRKGMVSMILTTLMYLGCLVSILFFVITVFKILTTIIKEVIKDEDLQFVLKWGITIVVDVIILFWILYSIGVVTVK
jgi:hypothetical protein